jgi:hypothetical protein
MPPLPWKNGLSAAARTVVHFELCLWKQKYTYLGKIISALSVLCCSRQLLSCLSIRWSAQRHRHRLVQQGPAFLPDPITFIISFEHYPVQPVLAFNFSQVVHAFLDLSPPRQHPS